MVSIVFEYVDEEVFFEVVKKAQFRCDKYPYFTLQRGPEEVLETVIDSNSVPRHFGAHKLFRIPAFLDADDKACCFVQRFDRIYRGVGEYVIVES